VNAPGVVALTEKGRPSLQRGRWGSARAPSSAAELW
jgi:hypothetical protein